MSLNAAAFIVDNSTPEELSTLLNLRPLGEEGPTDDVLLTPSDDRVCLVEHGHHIIGIDGAGLVAGAFEKESLDLSGRVVAAGVVGTVDYAALRVFDNGALVRHLEFSEGEFIADEGTPLAGEESFLEEDFVDGDVLISELPRLAGITDPVDLFQLRGQMYSVGA